MPMCDKDVAYTQQLARSEPAEVAEIEEQCATLEHKIYIKTGVVKRIIDKRGVKVARHHSSPSSRSR